MKKARIIITTDCERKCTYCVNRQFPTVIHPAPLDNLDKSFLDQFESISITGGEPMLNPKRTLALLRHIRRQGFKGRLYLYTAWYKHWRLSLPYMLLLTGIHFTLHEKSTQADMQDFARFQWDAKNWSVKYPKISFRLFVHSGIRHPVEIWPNLWSRVEFKPYEQDCKLPEDEELFLLDPLTYFPRKGAN